MLMSKGSLSLSHPLPRSLARSLHPSLAPSRSLSLGESSGSIADLMVWPMLYLSGQAMILSALNVIYSKRLPKSTQRDRLHRDLFSQPTPSLSLTHSHSLSHSHTPACTYINARAHTLATHTARTHTHTLPVFLFLLDSLSWSGIWRLLIPQGNRLLISATRYAAVMVWRTSAIGPLSLSTAYILSFTPGELWRATSYRLNS